MRDECYFSISMDLLNIEPIMTVTEFPSGKPICRYDDLIAGNVLAIEREGHKFIVFLYAGKLHCYLNACAHFGVPLNVLPDYQFFNPDRSALVCQVHYARYHPEDGRCLGGDCDGGGLQNIEIRTEGGWVVFA